MLRPRPRSGSGPFSTTLTLAALAAAAASGCRCGPGGPDPDGGGNVVPTEVGTQEGFVRDAEPRLDAEAALDPACTGHELALGSVVVDPRCAINSTRARQLRALLEGDGGDAGALPLRQDARVTSEGRLELRLVNTGVAALTLPLSYHARLPAFTALAEDEQFTLYELEAPRLEITETQDAGAKIPGEAAEAGAKSDRPHFARIILVPGAAAVATVTVSRSVTRVMRRGKRDACADAGAAASAEGGSCHVTRLPGGRYTLHVGELLTDVEAGPPARISWEIP